MEYIGKDLATYEKPAIRISENHIIVFGAQNHKTLQCIYCEVLGNRIITTNTTYLGSSSGTWTVISVETLTENKVCFTYFERTNSYDDSNKLHMCVCSINGSSITKESDTIIKSGTSFNDWNYSKIVKVNDNKVIITYLLNPKELYGTICEINEDNSVTIRSKCFYCFKFKR